MRRWIHRIKGYRAFFKRYGFWTGLVVIAILPQVREATVAAMEKMRRYESNSLQDKD